MWMCESGCVRALVCVGVGCDCKLYTAVNCHLRHFIEIRNQNQIPEVEVDL